MQGVPAVAADCSATAASEATEGPGALLVVKAAAADKRSSAPRVPPANQAHKNLPPTQHSAPGRKPEALCCAVN